MALEIKLEDWYGVARIPSRKLPDSLREATKPLYDANGVKFTGEVRRGDGGLERHFLTYEGAAIHAWEDDSMGEKGIRPFNIDIIANPNTVMAAYTRLFAGDPGESTGDWAEVLSFNAHDFGIQDIHKFAIDMKKVGDAKHTGSARGIHGNWERHDITTEGVDVHAFEDNQTYSARRDLIIHLVGQERNVNAFYDRLMEYYSGV